MEELKEIIYEAYRKTEFLKKFKELIDSYSNFNDRMPKLENKIVKELFLNEGYKVKVFNPGQDFYFEESFLNYKLRFELTKKGGVISSRTDIYSDESKPEMYTNLYFVYRILVDNMSLEILPISYTNIDDFNDILKKLLIIYSDFKAQFLKLLEAKGLI